ncbi:unnamed protein product [Orchesella dallaii]|uniref:Uncharacterized protein n=1 Tax=Orchesella dallaii TaxID=48710 RepID=A0ABP1RLJ1_9HEXA
MVKFLNVNSVRMGVIKCVGVVKFLFMLIPVNSNLINLCGLLGRDDCVFKIDGNGGGYSEIRRTEIITHFTDVHKKSYGCAGKFVIGGESIKTRILECLPGQQQNISLLCSLTEEGTSPLFLVTMKICTTANSISFTCIQLWGKDTTEKYKVQFSFVNGTCSAKAPIAKDVLSNIIRKLDPLLISWTLNVYTPWEAEYVLKSCPVYINIPVLTDAKFGDNTDDNLLVEISLIT